MSQPPARSALERAELDAFARRITEFMARKGLSQSDLARAVWGSTEDARGRDVARNRDRISHYVRGSQLPEAKTMRALAEALGVSVEELHPPAAAPAAGRAAPDVTLTTIGGRPDLALLTVNKMLPIGVAVKILALLSEVRDGGEG